METNEEWRDIKGWEGIYQVSSEGRVRSIDRYINKSDGSTQFCKGKMLKPKKSWSGYYSVQLQNGSRTLNTNISRIVAIAFIPNPEGKPEVDHIDTDKTNNTVENLRWVTRYENQHNPVTEKKTCLFCGDRLARDVAAEHGISYGAFMARRERGATIEEACTCDKWASKRIDGVKAVDIAKSNGISSTAFHTRLRRGWSLEDACTIPKTSAKYTYKGRSAVNVAKEKGISKATFHCRVNKYGWTIEEACTIPVCEGGKSVRRK